MPSVAGRLLWTLFLAATLFSPCLSPTRAAPQTTTTARPSNVLFIAIDDLNDWTGCLGGHPQALTPNLDRLAQRGMLFSNAHCAAPACNPSRAALMTGLRPSTSGIYLNPQPWRQSPVLAQAVTIPQHFQAHGYRAIGSGKIYHGAFPDPESWDVFWPSLTNQSPGDPMPPDRPLNGFSKTSHWDWGPIDASTETMGDSQVADWVIDQLQKENDQPLFLACGFFRPHLPWYAPKKFFEPFPLDTIILPRVQEDDLDDIPPAGVKMAKPNGDHRWVTENQQWKQAVQAYLASVYFMDHCLGRVIEALEQRPDKDNWVVVLWSDHGWHLGEKLHWRKFALWEEATHNVMLWVVPGMTAPGSRCNEPVSLIDIYPTLIELCRLQAKPELEGASLVPQLRVARTPRLFPTLTTHGRGNHSLRSNHWRYIRYADGSEELYDRRVDPMEWRNLAQDPAYASIKVDLAKHLPKSDAAAVRVKRN